MKILLSKGETQSGSPSSIAHDYRYYCKLFNDMISRNPCLMRRSEFNGKKNLACGGCSKDTMMNSRRNRLSALRERG